MLWYHAVQFATHQLSVYTLHSDIEHYHIPTDLPRGYLAENTQSKLPSTCQDNTYQTRASKYSTSPNATWKQTSDIRRPSSAAADVAASKTRYRAEMPEVDCIPHIPMKGVMILHLLGRQCMKHCVNLHLSDVRQQHFQHPAKCTQSLYNVLTLPTNGIWHKSRGQVDIHHTTTIKSSNEAHLKEK